MNVAVIKIGGSLCGSPRLERILDVLTQVRNRPLVIVPGGGPFADAVRQVQSLMPFDDGLAHRLALDAMAHLGEVLAARRRGLILADGSEAIVAAHRRGELPIWHPAELRSGHPDIAETWQVTSDSLALWLATRLKADLLVLVKSVDAGGQETPAALSKAGIVDAAFPAYAARFAGRIAIAGPASDDDLAGLLDLELSGDSAR